MNSDNRINQATKSTALTQAFLDDVNKFNGPLYFIPGSHQFGTHQAVHDTATTSYPLLVVDQKVVREIIANVEAIDSQRRIVAATGKRGQTTMALT